MYVKILLYLIFLLKGDRVGGKGVCGRLMSPAHETQTMREIRLLRGRLPRKGGGLTGMDLKYFHNNEHSITFKIGVLLKITRPKYVDNEVILQSFDKPEICSVKTVKYYISKTRSIRKSTKLHFIQNL